jgi:hypothetical protein
MSIFERDDTAWSAWTKTIEQFAGDPGSPTIVQAPSILRPIDVRPGVHPKLAWYRKYLVGDTIPVYAQLNSNAYIGPGKSMSLGYQQYLYELNREVIKRFVNPSDAQSIDRAAKRYEAAQQALASFRRDANEDWRRKKQADPTLTREAWDENYGPMGYTAHLAGLQKQVTQRYGEYIVLATPYPQVMRVANALARMDVSVGSQIRLPTSQDDLTLGEEGWEACYKTNLEPGEDWDVFFGKDSPDVRQIDRNSVQSSYYNHRWSGGGSVSYGFFSVSGGASGGTVENHLRTDTQSVKFGFKRLVLATVTRGTWFDGGLVYSRPYLDYVDKSAYWDATGTLNLIPVAVILGRGPTIEISTSKTAVDSYKNWRHVSGGGGFGIGSFRIGARGSSSTEWGSTSDTSTDTKIQLEDKSGQAYVIGVVSQKMDELAASPEPAIKAALADYERLANHEAAHVAKHRSLA